MKCHFEQQATNQLNARPRLKSEANKRSDLRNFSVEFSNLFARSFRTLGEKFVKFFLYLFHLGLNIDKGNGEKVW